MKPISLRFRCFGPYMKEQYIDFDDLRTYGIFLISGKTGAGKTTILDAMCMALYGESSGGARGKFEDMRCKLAGAGDITLVDYIFESDGVRYRFQREIKLARTKLNTTQNCMRFESGEWVPMMANPKETAVKAKAEEILGLNASQFRQIIILPQGKFESLLVANSKDKADILTQIFHTERWDRIVAKIKEQVDSEGKEVEYLKNSIDAVLRNENAESVGQLEDMNKQLWQEVCELDDAILFGNSVKERIAAELERALEENKVFEALDAAEKTFAELNDAKADFAAEAVQLQAAERADSIKAYYESFRANEKQLAEAEKVLVNAENESKTAEKKRINAEERLKQHNLKEAEIKALGTRLSLMENAVQNYEKLESLEKAEKQAEQLKTNAENAADKAEKAYKKASEKHTAETVLRDELISRLQHAQMVYNATSAGRLAEKLQDGMPCPVCGSTHHPSKAQLSTDTEQVTDRMLSELNEQVGNAANAVSSAETAKKSAEEKLNLAKGEFTRAVASYTEARAQLNSAKAALIDGIADMSALMREIEAAKKLISQYQKDSEIINGEVLETNAKAAAARSVLDTRKAGREQLASEALASSEKWVEVRNTNGFATDKIYEDACMDRDELNYRNSMHAVFESNLEGAASDLEKKRKAVEGKEKPDIGSIRNKQTEFEQNMEKCFSESGVKSAEHARRDKLIKSVKKDSDAYLEKLKKYEKDRDFYDKLAPRSGVSLQRYVLGIMFGSVIEAANALLCDVQGGRYRLHRTDAAATGNQGGLDLEVFDANNGQKRGVASLSGGEKFLVALSLAIGLSTVIQAQSNGIRMEAMFVDEGFGSLDNEAIPEAVSILRTVQSGNGLVGVISHVDRLGGLLPYSIEVCKGEKGNYLKFGQ